MNRLHEIWDFASKCVALLLGLSYACGVVCVSTFLNTFNIHETLLEAFKIKYFQVGAMFLFFPMCVLLPLAMLLSRVHDINRKLKLEYEHSNKTVGDLNSTSFGSMAVAGGINVCLLLYVVTLFFPHNFMVLNAKKITLLIAGTVAIPLLLRLIVSSVEKRILPTFYWLGPVIWTLFAFAMILSDFTIMTGSLHDIWYVLMGDVGQPAQGIHYFVYVTIVFIIIVVVNMRTKLLSGGDGRAKWEWRVVAGSFSILLAYRAMVAFGLYIYPWIPSSKGGGDYADSAQFSVQLRLPANPAQAPVVVTTIIEEKRIPKMKFIVIEQTDTTTYLADPADAGGPKKWRFMGQLTNTQLPKIIAIRNDAMDAMIVEPRPVP